MGILEQDIFEIAQFIISNMRLFKDDYRKSSYSLPFSEYIQSRIELDLKHKYNVFDIQEVFEDERIQTLLSIISNNEDKNDTKIKIH